MLLISVIHDIMSPSTYDETHLFGFYDLEVARELVFHELQHFFGQCVLCDRATAYSNAHITSQKQVLASLCKDLRNGGPALLWGCHWRVPRVG